MPKREKTPDTEPDSKFLAVYQTYPANADMELEDDQIRLARWIESIIPADYLVAIHYKPKVRGDQCARGPCLPESRPAA